MILECLYRLGKWVERDNNLKLRLQGIEEKCYHFEFHLVAKIKEAGKAYASISQNEFQVAGEALSDLNSISCLLIH